MQIGGERRWGASRADIRSPHRKELSIAEYAVGADKDFADAIDAALKARRTWAATSYHERAAVLLRAASLLAGPWRDTINAATMLGQSKTVHQAEIDAACESVDFWRYNAYFGDQLLGQQPGNDGTAWNRLEYRPLEGFVFAVSPFNFTSIGANLPTAAALMGNTVVFKPATQTLLVSHFLMEILNEAGPAARRDQHGQRQRRKDLGAGSRAQGACRASISPDRPRCSRACGGRSARTSITTAPTRGWSARPVARTSWSRTSRPTRMRCAPR